MNPDLAKALDHPVVASWSVIRRDVKKRAKLEEALRRVNERRHKAEAIAAAELARWRAERESALLAGEEVPDSPPKAPDLSELTRDYQVVHAARLAADQAITAAVADAAPGIVAKLAAHLDDQLAAAAREPVAHLPEALAAVEESRAAIWAIARTRWSRAELPVEPAPLTIGLLAETVLAGAGHLSAAWGSFLAAQEAKAKAAKADAARLEALREQAAANPGEMVSTVEGPAFGHPPTLPPVDTRLAGRR